MMTLTDELPATATGRKRWTRDELEFLENAGLLKGRYELLDGEIINKMSQNSPHAMAVMFVIEYLLSIFGRTRVRTQAAIEVRETEGVTNRPEPDVYVLHEVVRVGKPQGEDVLLAVKVSDTTQADDYGPKVGLYARAGVAEYWVLDLARRVLVVYRSPENGEWLVREDYVEGAQIAPLPAPNSPISVDQLLPPLPETAD